MELSSLPTLNAALNSASAFFLTIGYLMIRQRRIDAHRACMLAAFATSGLFLVSYVIYHVNVGSVPFTGQGALRTVYFIILVSHVCLATLILPLAVVTLSRALRGQFDRHARLARWTLPLWLYVSATGVVVYLMLYKL